MLIAFYRLSKNASILARIKEIKEAVAAEVVWHEARRRSWRVAVADRFRCSSGVLSLNL